MSILDKAKSGDGKQPLRILVAGPEGIGKSTFASKAPAPLFICAEDGLTGLEHVKRLTPQTMDELNEILKALATEKTEHQTLVVDTTDWLERLLASSMCIRDKKSDIEDYGYGKGYVLLETELVKVLQKLDALRHGKGMTIILLAHVQIRTFNDPRGTAYDRFEMKGHKKFTGLLREWPDANLFAVQEVFQTKQQGSQKDKTIAGERVMHTTWAPAWDAKNRLNLPEELPLEWEAFEKAVAENSPTALREQVRKLHVSAKLDAAKKLTWEKWLLKIESQPADKLKQAIENLTKLQ